MVFPRPPGRRDTTRHSAFCLLCSLARMSVCPTDKGTSRTVSPPCPLTERERVRVLNLWFCPSIPCTVKSTKTDTRTRSEEHTSELQSPVQLVCRFLLEKKKMYL